MKTVLKRLFLNRKLRLPLLVTVVLLGLSLTPLRLVPMIGVIFLWAAYWPFSKRQDSFVLRLALAFLLVTCFQQLVAMACWALHIPVGVPLVVGLQLAIFLYLFWTRDPKVTVQLVGRSDVTALIVSLASVGVIMFGTLHGGPLLQQLLRFSTTGYDNAQHVSLTQTLYDNKGFVYGPVDKTINKVMFSNLSSYPQGWSMSASLWWHGASSHLDMRAHPGSVLFLYFFMMMLWYGLLIYLFCRLVLYLLAILRDKPNNIVGHVGAALFTCLVEALFLVSILVFGFASFYPALVLPLGIVFLLAELILEAKDPDAPKPFIIGGLMLAAGMSFSWLLSAPVAYIMVALGVLAYFRTPRAFVQWLRGRWLLIVASVLLVGLASLQGLVQVLYGVKDLINIPGGVNPLNNLVIVLFLVTAVFVISNTRLASTKLLFAASVSGAFLIAGAIYIYQYVTSGQATYFSTKMSYVAVLLIMVFGSAALLAFIQDKLTDKTGKLVNVLFVAGLILFMPIAGNVQLGTTAENGIGSVPYVQGERYLAPGTADVISGLLLDKKAVDGNIVVYRQVNFAEDVLTSHFLQIFIRHEIPACITTIGTGLTAGWSIDPVRLKECARQQHKTMYIIASSKNYDQLQASYADTPQVKVVPVNDPPLSAN